MATIIGKKLLDSYNALKGQTSNFLQKNPTPGGYIAGKIAPIASQTFNNFATQAGNFIRPMPSPIPSQGFNRTVEPFRNIVGNTAEAVIRDVPSIVGSMARTAPPVQLGQQIRGVMNPTIQPQLQQQRQQDIYNSAKGYGYTTGGVANVVGGIVGMGMGAVGNVLQGKPLTQDYAENFAGGVQTGAAFGPVSKAIGGVLNAAKPLSPKLIKSAINTIQSLDTPIMKFGGVMGHKDLKEIAIRAIARGGREAFEGVATGSIRPLAEGETRAQAITSDVIQSVLMGVAMQAGGDFNEAKLKPILKNAGVSIKQFNYWLQDQGLVGGSQGGYIKFGEEVGISKKTTGTQSPDPKLKVNEIIPNSLPQKVQSRGQLSQQTKKNLSQSSSRGLPLDTAGKAQQPQQSPVSQVPLGGSIAQKVEVPPQNLNVNRLNDLSPQQKTEVLQLDAKGVREVLSNDEIIRIAQKAGFDTKTYSTDQTAEMIAKQLNTRRQVVELENMRTKMIQSGASEEELQKITSQVAQSARASRMQGTQLGRELQARKIMADEINTPMQKVFQLLDLAGINPDVYEKAAAKVDFYNPQEAMKFYRQFAPGKKREWLDLVRYNSMLSSPNTWINNFFSNSVNTGIITPIEKTLTGTIDFIASPFRGGKRNAFAMEGPVYAKGYVTSLGRATHKFADVLRNKSLSTNLDVRQIPLALEGRGAARYKALSLPTRILEGTDQFFQALTQGGETAALKYREGKGVNVGDIQSQVEANAAYRLFRSKLKDEKQGAVLNAIDEFTSKIEGIRNSKSLLASTVAKFTLPFVRTPMNIFKQGFEYSPAGITTLIGAQNKTEQLSKVILGSAGIAGTLALLESGRLTWAEPTDQKKKNAFRAAGLQPYSIKIGNKWVSFQKLPPALSFPLAFTSAVHDAYKNKLITDSQLDVVMNAVAKYGNFYADQSYVKQIGDAVASVKGDTEGFARVIGNYAQQLVPYRAALGWLARLTDPYQRKIDTDANILDQQVQQLMTQIPFMSMNVPARQDEFGQPIPNQNKEINALSPLRVTNEKLEEKQYYDLLQEQSLMNKNLKSLKDQAEKEAIKGPQVQAAESKIDLQSQIKKKMEEDKARTMVKIRGITQQTEDKVFYQKEDGEVGTVNLKFGTKPPTMTGIEEIDKSRISEYKGKITSRIKEIGTLLDMELVSKEEAVKELNELMKMKKGTSGGKGKKFISDAELLSAYKKAITAAYATPKRSSSSSSSRPVNPIVTLQRQNIKSLR